MDCVFPSEMRQAKQNKTRLPGIGLSKLNCLFDKVIQGTQQAYQNFGPHQSSRQSRIWDQPQNSCFEMAGSES